MHLLFILNFTLATILLLSCQESQKQKPQLKQNALENIQSVKMVSVADFDGNGKVDFGDFLKFSAAYDKEVKEGQQADLNNDGKVQFDDFLKFAEEYGKIAEQANLVTSVNLMTEGPIYNQREYSFEVQVKNEGPHGATNVVTEVSCPIGSTTLPSKSSATKGNYTQGVIDGKYRRDWQINSLAEGEEASLEVVCFGDKSTPPHPYEIFLQRARSDQLDLQPAGDQVELVIDFAPSLDLAIDVIHITTGPYRVGDHFAIRIGISSAHAVPTGSNPRIEKLCPDGTRYVSVGVTSGITNAANGAWSLPNKSFLEGIWRDYADVKCEILPELRGKSLSFENYTKAISNFPDFWDEGNKYPGDLVILSDL